MKKKGRIVTEISEQTTASDYINSGIGHAIIAALFLHGLTGVRQNPTLETLYYINVVLNAGLSLREITFGIDKERDVKKPIYLSGASIVKNNIIKAPEYTLRKD